MPYTTGPVFMSDFFVRNKIIQQVAGISAKNLLIDVLRELFIEDSFYPLRLCQYGYIKTPDHTGMDEDSDESSKIYIGNVFRYEGAFLPAIIVRQSGGSAHPISFNQEGIPGYGGSIRYREDVIQDGYGNISTVTTPDSYIYAGAWDLSYDVKIYAESTEDRDELASIVSVGLQHVHRYDLQQAGLFVKKVSFGSEGEEDHNNDKYYTQSITVDAYGEWRREIPVGDLIDRIAFIIDIGTIVDGEVESNNLRIINEIIELDV